jgi:cytidyltransferase-like protein
MSTIVIMPGGFHPFHAGHASLYQSALKAFPNAEVYVAATNDTKTRPFPFAIKEKLAKVAGVASGHFVQVKSPFQPREITDNLNPEQDVVIFVRSEKDRNESPKPGGIKKDGSPAYFQPWTGKDVQPFGKHAYMAYLPTVEFGPGISSATEIRNAWPNLNDKRKTAMVMSLYPATQKNPKLAANVVKMLDMGMGTELTEVGPAKIFHPQYVDVYFLEGSRREPILVNRKVPYHLIDKYLELVVKKYNLQQGRFEFRNAEEEPIKVTESVDYLEEK